MMDAKDAAGQKSRMPLPPVWLLLALIGMFVLDTYAPGPRLLAGPAR
jgi:hypothetical protein